MLEFFSEIQKKLSKLVEFKKLDKIDIVVACDVSYVKDYGYCCATLFDFGRNEIIKRYLEKDKVYFPYIPTFLFLREAPLIIKTIKKIKEDFDLIVVDGHGLTHPRKAGLATIIGILTEKPCIGIAKSFLYGEIVDNTILVDGMKVGIVNKNIVFSIGSNIDFDSLYEFAKKVNFSYPDFLKDADIFSRKFSKSKK